MHLSCRYFVKNDCEEIDKYLEHLEKNRKFDKGDKRLETIEEILNEEYVWFAFGVKNRNFVLKMRLENLLYHMDLHGVYTVKHRKGIE